MPPRDAFRSVKLPITLFLIPFSSGVPGASLASRESTTLPAGQRWIGRSEASSNAEPCHGADSRMKRPATDTGFDTGAAGSVGPMRRVLVIGSGGAGKSTFATRLSARTGLPVIHLDALFWKAGWTPTPPSEWAGVVVGLLARPSWIMDGNYGGTLDARLAACDTVVFLDLPRRVCLWRVMKRWWRQRGRVRPDMAAGCEEQLSLEFLRWIWGYPANQRPTTLRKLGALDGGQRVVVLRSPAAVEAYLTDLTAGDVQGERA
jgi:adenylate kinase family enzyme